MVIKANPECASDRYILYQASSELLPNVFEGGLSRYGKAHSVKLEEIDAGKHVEISIKYIDTKIVIRLVGSYLTFLISMPAEFVNSTSDSSVIELCTKGCPKSEIIDYQRYLAYKKKDRSSNNSVNMTREEALALCRSANLVDFYLDSCVFDLLTTGNETFKYAAQLALQDVLKLDPNFSKTQENRTTLHVHDKYLLQNSGNSVRTSGYLNLSTFLVLVSITLTLLETLMHSS